MDRPFYVLDATPVFRVSSRCSKGGCVAVAQAHSGRVLVRDDTNPRGTVLACSPDGWGRFVADVREGRWAV